MFKFVMFFLVVVVVDWRNIEYIYVKFDESFFVIVNNVGVK